jgi:hypothetical protein
MGKLHRCNNHNICAKLPVNEMVETSVISTCLLVDCLELKTDRMLSTIKDLILAILCISHLLLIDCLFVCFVLSRTSNFSATWRLLCAYSTTIVTIHNIATHTCLSYKTNTRVNQNPVPQLECFEKDPYIL